MFGLSMPMPNALVATMTVDLVGQERLVPLLARSPAAIPPW
jgi:hypothetical protein